MLKNIAPRNGHPERRKRKIPMWIFYQKRYGMSNKKQKGRIYMFELIFCAVLGFFVCYFGIGKLIYQDRYERAKQRTHRIENINAAQAEVIRRLAKAGCTINEHTDV